jgi:sulfur relay (sulfurtransferase) complex TusBCD TusD component (DsrE family)
MKASKYYIVALAFLMTGFVLTSGLVAYAGKEDPLFTNLSSDDSHRSAMALRFSKAMMERGHPLTVFLNDKGVMIASKTKSGEFADQQKELSALMGKGAVVIVCQSCLQHFGLKDTELLDGVKLGTPDMTSEALFKEHTRTMAW